MNSFDRLIEQARNKAMRKSVGDGPVIKIGREPSLNESEREWHPPNWGILFCCHDRSYFDVCSHCKRTRQRAQLEFELFCKRRGIQV